MKEKLVKIKEFLLNPHLLICVGIAWFITNGWAYVVLGLGTYYRITVMVSIAGVYLAVLWSPFCLEGILTAIIAIALLKFLFPNDKQTLEKLENMRAQLREKKKNKRLDKKNSEDV